MVCNVTKLDDGKVKKIKQLEQKVGKTLLAYTCYPVAPAELSKDELTQISAAEKELGLVLVAVKG